MRNLMLMLIVTFTGKVTHLCAITWDLLIGSIKLYVSSVIDIFTIMLGYYEKLNGLTLLTASSN